MDELNFRRRIYADPNDSASDINKACQEDKQLAKFRADMQDFDKQIAAAMEVTPPENLSERILLGQTIDFQRKQKQKHRVHLAIAASVAFTVGIVFQMNGVSPRYDNLSDHALAHMISEVDHIPGTATYTLEQLNSKLVHFGGEMANDIAPIKFANFCDFDGTTSLHLVFQGENGDVTVFVVPSDSGLKASDRFSDMQYHGQTVETQKASMVIITDKKQSVNNWTEKLNKAIKWQKA